MVSSTNTESRSPAVSPSLVQEGVGGPRVATHLNERIYVEARDLLKECLAKALIGKFYELLRYLPQLTFAQLEALDKVRCNCFRHQVHRLEDLKKGVRDLSLVPWHQRYRWSGLLTFGGAGLQVGWFFLQGSTMGAIARVIAAVPFCSGALACTVIKMREVYLKFSHHGAQAIFPRKNLLNRGIKVDIEFNQKIKFDALNISINRHQLPTSPVRDDEGSDVAGPSHVNCEIPNESAGPALGEGNGSLPTEDTGPAPEEAGSWPAERGPGAEAVVAEGEVLTPVAPNREPAGSAQGTLRLSIAQRARASADQAERRELQREIARANERALIAESALAQVLQQLREQGTEVRIHREARA